MNPYITIAYPYGSPTVTKRYTAQAIGTSPAQRTAKRSVDFAVDGSVLVTLGLKTYRVRQLNIMFDGTETGNYGTFAQLEAAYQQGVIKFTDFDGTTQFTAFFVGDFQPPPTPDPTHGFVIVPIALHEVA